MSSSISSNYRELLPEEVKQVAVECAEAWKAEMIPQRQYELCVKRELEAFRNGERIEPFTKLVNCLKRLSIEDLRDAPTLLDVGASGGYYREVLRIAGFGFSYTGCDFSESFRKLALELYPDIRFDVADARQLPYEDASFEVVLSGCCILHMSDYEKAIAETARVARKYALFNKTPIRTNRPTAFYEKTGYGVRMFEIVFGETELLKLFAKYGLRVLHYEDVTPEPDIHRTYLLEKVF